MLLMVEKRIRGGMCQAIHRYAKANNRYMKNYNKNNESSYLEYLDANNLYRWAMSKKLPVNKFMWYNDYLSDFTEEFIKNYDENSHEGYFLEVDINTQNNYLVLIKNYHFYQKEKIRKSRKTCLQYRRRRKICHTHKSFKTSIKSWVKI